MNAEVAVNEAEDVPRCGAMGRSGAPCRRVAGAGTDHVGFGRCKHHTGSTRSGRLSAARQIAAQIAAADVDDTASIDDIMLEQIRFQARLVVVLRSWAAELDPDSAIGPVGNPEHMMRAEPHALWAWRGVEEDRLGAMCKRAGDFGLAERAITLEERHGELLATVARAIVTELGFALTDPRAEAAIRKALTAGAQPGGGLSRPDGGA